MVLEFLVAVELAQRELRLGLIELIILRVERVTLGLIGRLSSLNSYLGLIWLLLGLSSLHLYHTCRVLAF